MEERSFKNNREIELPQKEGDRRVIKDRTSVALQEGK
jgi:hypothetical protein